MSITVCLSTNQTLNYPHGGGHLWVYLNWALGLQALGCEVIWLETVSNKEIISAQKSRRKYGRLRLEQNDTGWRITWRSTPGTVRLCLTK